MATRRKAADDPTTDDAEMAVPSTLPAVVDMDDESEESVLDRLRSMGGDDRDRMRIKVYRKTNAGTLEWCSDYTVGEWEERDIAGVRQDWGPGTYEMRVVSSGRRGILMRDVFRIANDSKPAANPIQAAPQSSELADVVRMLAEGQQRILEAVSQRPDPAAQLQSTLALMVSMREAMGLNQPAPPPPPAADPSAMLTQIVGAVRQLREVAQEVSPPAEDSDSPLAMFGKVADIVKMGMGQQGQAPAFQPLTVPDSINQEGEPEMLGMLVLRGQLQTLVDMAARGASPQEGGKFVAEKLPDDLLPHLELPNVVDILATVNPKVRDHSAWMLQARDEALRILAGDGDSTPMLAPKGAIPGTPV